MSQLTQTPKISQKHDNKQDASQIQPEDARTTHIQHKDRTTKKEIPKSRSDDATHTDNKKKNRLKRKSKSQPAKCNDHTHATHRRRNKQGVPQNQPADMHKFDQGKVSCKRGLPTLQPFDSYANICCLQRFNERSQATLRAAKRQLQETLPVTPSSFASHPIICCQRSTSIACYGKSNDLMTILMPM